MSERRFLTAKDMAEFKYDEAVARSAARRRGENVVGVRQTVCGCGHEGCCYTSTLGDSGASLSKQPKQPTKHPKRSEHYMFSGKII